MNVYSYVDTTRANADGSFPVYVIVKNAGGRFLVGTGLTSSGKLVGRSFPKSDSAWRQKTALLGNIMASVERVCLEHSLMESDNKSLKAAIMRDVFGKRERQVNGSLADAISSFGSTKRSGTAGLYAVAERRVRQFDRRATLDNVDSKWLERFNAWCLSEGMAINGVGMVMRCVRATFNHARKSGLTGNYPFLGFHIVEEETRPNNIRVEDLRKLRDWKCEPWQKKYVDFFMLSFYLAGINPCDLLLMRRDAMRNGHVSFVRRKTDKEGSRKVRTIILPVVDEAREIIDRYPSGEGYLLGFMDGRKDYHSFMKKCNEALKKVGTTEIVKDKLGKMRKVEYRPILPDITLYTARYTFGSIAANDLDISERTIGMCLGHSWSRNVTSRYMAYDQGKIDRAVRKVVDFVGEG